MENLQMLKVLTMWDLFTLCVLQLICFIPSNQDDRIKTFQVRFELSNVLFLCVLANLIEHLISYSKLLLCTHLL